MFSGRTIRLGKVLGIRIGADFSWFIVLFLVIWQFSEGYQDESGGFSQNTAFAMAVAAALLAFLSIVLHELGHAVVAKRNGIEVARIDLWMFGGLAQLKRDTRSPGEEFRIAAAGPLVTLVIAAVCLGLTSFDALTNPADPQGSEVRTVVADLGVINLFLLVFNLIPAFPLDGGRIARAAAWKLTGDRRKATRFTGALGVGFGWFLIAVGGYLMFATDAFGSGIWLILIGFFINQAARASVMQTDVTAVIEGVRVGDVMDREPVSVRSDARLDSALDEFFLRYGWPWFPVVDHLGRFVGLLQRESVERVPEALRPTSTVDEVMARDPGGALKVNVDEPLETLLGSDQIRAIGAMMAVDDQGVLKGVVTMDQLRRALRPSAPPVA